VEDFPYATAAAFRTALKDRFAQINKSGSGYTLDELQRQFAYVSSAGAHFHLAGR